MNNGFLFPPKTAFKSIDIGTEIFKNAPVSFSTRALKRLEEKGVLFARLEDLEGVVSYSAIYKGEILVPNGSAKELRKSLDGAWGKVGDDLVRELEGIIVRKIVNSDGLRGAKILTKTEKSTISNYAKKYYNYEAIHFADDLSTNNTGYMASYDLLYINTDIMPGTLGAANSRLSWKAAMAHEIEGHRAASLTDKTFFNPSLSNQANDLLEEMQASLRAHLHGKGLSSVEKADLLDDALERFNTHNNYFNKSIYENYSFEELKQVLWLDNN